MHFDHINLVLRNQTFNFGLKVLATVVYVHLGRLLKAEHLNSNQSTTQVLLFRLKQPPLISSPQLPQICLF
jgi:hypothetical protein